MGDGLTERFAFLHVRDDVVEHRVRGADCQRGPAQPRQRDRLGVVGVGGVVFAQPGIQRHRHSSSSSRPRAAARMPMLGSALTVRPLADDSTMNSAGLPFSWARDDEQLGVGRSRDQRLDAVEPVAARCAHRGGLQRGRVEQRLRLGDRHAGLRDVLTGELVQVGGLLVGAAPMGQRGRDAARRQDRQRQTHVAVGQRLGHQHVGDAGALRGDAVEVLGNVDRGDAQLRGLRDQVGRIARGRVGVVRGRPQHLFGEFIDGLDDQLLVVVGRQVVVVLRRWTSAGSVPLRRFWTRLNCRVDAPAVEKIVLAP